MSIEGLFELGKDITVSSPEHQEKPSVRPAHHLNDQGTKFTNPWVSWRGPQMSSVFKTIIGMTFNGPVVPSNITSLIPVITPNWGSELSKESIKATWLGHACFLVELPTAKGATRGARVLFDPVFQDRCSPVQFMGPKRFTPMPCHIDDIPPIEAIVLSHNHYDHTDSYTIKTLYERYRPHVFAPLGNQPYLSSLGVSRSHIHAIDWWDSRTVSFTLASSDSSASVSSTSTPVSFKLTCTPAQHTANRGVFDRWQTLWASWALEDPASGKKVYFGGDTGYRSVRDGEDPETSPVCPAFKEIGEKLGPFDFAAIPIGAYQLRETFSCMHVHPEESVRIFKDVKAKKALGMHWGTWILTSEPVMGPPEELRRECDKAKVTQEEFDVCALGETRPF